jgi:hypothetical protein
MKEAYHQRYIELQTSIGVEMKSELEIRLTTRFFFIQFVFRLVCFSFSLFELPIQR